MVFEPWEAALEVSPVRDVTTVKTLTYWKSNAMSARQWSENNLLHYIVRKPQE